MYVEWDFEDQVYEYSYGHMGHYSVLTVDEPRLILPGQPIVTGCVVTPGMSCYIMLKYTQNAVVLG